MRWHSASARLLPRPLQDESADALKRSTGRMLEAQKELPMLCLRHVSIIAVPAALLSRGAGTLGCVSQDCGDRLCPERPMALGELEGSTVRVKRRTCWPPARL